jgi:hypothetical protein
MTARPAVSRRWLFLLAALAWLGVGVGLMAAAAMWLAADGDPVADGLLGAGGVAAALLTGIGFGRIADRNVARLRALPDPACVFAFQSWRGWGTIVFMVALGWSLRHSGIPRPWLAPVYLAIGGGLARASWRYVRGGCK